LYENTASVRPVRTACAILAASLAAVLAPGALAAPQGLGSTITVVKQGNGNGTVTSNPAGISCGSLCSATFPSGLLVRLTATPAAGSIFFGWNGGSCVGSGPCTVGTTADATIQAIFYTAGYPLEVDVRGSGRVTSNPAGIACPEACSYTFAAGTQVRLRADPVAGATFLGWGGECSGTGACTVAITRAQSVTARFSVANVEARIVSTRFRQNGPPGARRVLQVRLAAEARLARVVVRVRRGSVTLASTVARDVDGRTTVRLPIRNAIVPGPARLRVTFASAAGEQAAQTRTIRIPALR
jgi:hypothetical protein